MSLLARTYSQELAQGCGVKTKPKVSDSLLKCSFFNCSERVSEKQKDSWKLSVITIINANINLKWPLLLNIQGNTDTLALSYA